MTSKFMKYGLSISVVALGGCILLEKALQRRYRSEDYYQNAVVMMQKYEAGAQILGRPVFSGKINLGNKDEFFLSPLSAKVSIPLKGSKQNGILHVLASRYDVNDKWDIDQLDLELKTSSQRWKFYDKDCLKADGRGSEQDASTSTSTNVSTQNTSNSTNGSIQDTSNSTSVSRQDNSTSDSSSGDKVVK